MRSEYPGEPASAATSGTIRPLMESGLRDGMSVVCQVGRSNSALTPPPVAAPFGRCPGGSFHTTSPWLVENSVPPTANTKRLDAGNSTLRELLESRPLIFVGYGIPEVDVDIVYALHRYRQRVGIKRWQLTTRGDLSFSSKERLRQMGIDPWPFDVPAIGYAALPGKLNAARRRPSPHSRRPGRATGPRRHR